MNSSSGRLLLVVCLVLVFATIPASSAFDDSNTSNFSQSTAVNSQQLVTTLTQLAANSNDTQLQQLISNLNSSISSGNANSTSAALAQLQNYEATKNESSVLSSLVQSLRPAGDGISINSDQLSSLLGLLGPNGFSSGLDQGNTTQQLSDLQSLENLLKNVNPALAGQLLNVIDKLSLGSTPSNTNVSFPSLKSNSLQTPSLAAPVLAKASSPLASIEQMLLPGAIVVAIIALFLMRNRFANLLRGQKIPGVAYEDVRIPEYDSSDPKKRIIFYFAKMLHAMKLRGFPKQGFETHREFAWKCGSRPEIEQVKTLSMLYEKAKFSGNQISESEANSAANELSRLETRSTGPN